MSLFVAVAVGIFCSPFGALFTASLIAALAYERVAQKRENPDQPKRRAPRRRTNPYLARMNGLSNLAERETK